MNITTATDKEIWYCIYDSSKKETIAEIQIEKGSTVIDNADALAKATVKCDTKTALEDQKSILKITKKQSDVTENDKTASK